MYRSVTGQRTFHFRAAKLWNYLLENIKGAVKSKLKFDMLVHDKEKIYVAFVPEQNED